MFSLLDQKLGEIKGGGIQPDYTFYQHGPTLLNRGYGSMFALSATDSIKLANGTGFAFPPETIAVINNFLLDGLQWMEYRGTYGFAAMDFGQDGLVWRKSWCFFDDSYVCLGSGITFAGDLEVATTLDQRLLDGPVTVSQKGSQQVLVPGEHVLNDVEWLHHDGVAYVFPEPAGVSMNNIAQTGSWKRISSDVTNLNLERGQEQLGGRGSCRATERTLGRSLALPANRKLFLHASLATAQTCTPSAFRSIR